MYKTFSLRISWFCLNIKTAIWKIIDFSNLSGKIKMGSSLFCLTGYKFFQTRENLLGSFQKSSLSISYKSIIIVIIQLFCVVFERLGLFTTNKICLSNIYIYIFIISLTKETDKSFLFSAQFLSDPRLKRWGCGWGFGCAQSATLRRSDELQTFHSGTDTVTGFLTRYETILRSNRRAQKFPKPIADSRNNIKLIIAVTKYQQLF